jgi:large subunit ribosomal protein L9
MANVRLILREDVPKLGDAGELVSVKPGFARNYLIPRGLASVATESSIKELEHQKRVIAEKLAKELKSMRAVKDRLESYELVVVEQAGEEGKLFGSVTSARVAELIAEKGVEIDRRKIDLADPIKTVGNHVVSVRLHKDVVASVKLEVRAAE